MEAEEHIVTNKWLLEDATLRQPRGPEKAKTCCKQQTPKFEILSVGAMFADVKALFIFKVLRRNPSHEEDVSVSMFKLAW